MNTDEIVGQFWHPESEDHKVFGLLRVDAEHNITLTTYQWLVPDTQDTELSIKEDKEFTCDIIIGQLEVGKSVILRKVHYSGNHMNGLVRYLFSIEFLSYDSFWPHETPLSLKYTGVTFRLDGIESLLGINIIKRELVNNGKFKPTSSITEPQIKKYKLDEQAIISINHSFSYTSNRSKNLQENRTFFDIQFKTPLEDYKILGDYLKPIMIFFCYLLGHYIPLSEVELKSEDQMSRNVLLPTIWARITQPNKAKPISRFSIQLIEKEELGEILCKFMKLFKLNPLLFDFIVFGTLRDSILMEYKFNTIVGALDSLVYSSIKPSNYIDKDVFRSTLVTPTEEFMKMNGLNTQYPDLYKRVVDQIKNSNKKVFKDMLLLAIDQHLNMLPVQVLKQKKKNVERIVKLRADYVHFRIIKETQDTDYYMDMQNTLLYANLVFDAIVFNQIGISNEFSLYIFNYKYRLLIESLSSDI